MRQDEMCHEYTLGGDETPSNGVYTTVAVMEDCSPLDIPPLAETIDPDALDRLLADDEGTIEVSFQYCGYTVSATCDSVRIVDADSD